MNIITTLGDSLSLARSEDKIYFKDTYSYLLNKSLRGKYLVLNKSKRGNTTHIQTDFQNLYDDVYTTESSYFVIQLGIVDCAPRIISKYEKEILRRFFSKKIQNLYIKIKSSKRRFLTKYFPNTYVSISAFEKKYEYLLTKICEQPGVNKVILINIADTNPENKRRSFNFEKNINNYNKIINSFSVKFTNNVKIFDLFSLSKIKKKVLLDDGIHISKETHITIAQELEKLLFSDIK